MRGATRARANAPRTPRAPRASARGGRDGASARPARAFPAKWNPFVNVPDAPDRMTDADRARADDSDGVLGYHDAARAMLRVIASLTGRRALASSSASKVACGSARDLSVRSPSPS